MSSAVVARKNRRMAQLRAEIADLAPVTAGTSRFEARGWSRPPPITDVYGFFYPHGGDPTRVLHWTVLMIEAQKLYSRRIIAKLQRNGHQARADKLRASRRLLADCEAATDSIHLPGWDIPPHVILSSLLHDRVRHYQMVPAQPGAQMSLTVFQLSPSFPPMPYVGLDELAELSNGRTEVKKIRKWASSPFWVAP